MKNKILKTLLCMETPSGTSNCKITGMSGREKSPLKATPKKTTKLESLNQNGFTLQIGKPYSGHSFDTNNSLGDSNAISDIDMNIESLNLSNNNFKLPFHDKDKKNNKISRSNGGRISTFPDTGKRLSEFRFR